MGTAEADRTAAEVADEMALDDEEIRRRLHRLRLGLDDRQRLAALAPRLRTVAHEVVAAFRRRIQDESEVRRLLPGGEMPDHLIHRLEAYLVSMFAGPYDQEYVAYRLRVGVMHQRHRIAPKWYISASSWLLSALLDALFGARRDASIGEVAAEVAAIIKVLHFDLSLVLETYFHADHQVMEQLATHDPLTGLPNHNLLQQTLGQRFCRDDSAPVCVLLVGLDRFKAINATLGHELGDRLLEQVGARLGASIGPAGMVARLGGDLFVVLCEQCGATGVADAAMGRIIDAFSHAFELGELAVNVHATVGVAIGGTGEQDASTLLRRAEAALLHAKSQRAASAVYAPEMDRYSFEQVRLVGELRRAIDDRQLVLHYQPKIDLVTQRVCGVEALVRWRDPSGRLRLPSRFIPLAEQTILIHPLTEYVLQAAAEQSARWQVLGMALPISVNVAAPNLLDAGLPGTIERLMSEYALPPGQLVLELTESSLLADPPRAHHLRAAARARLPALHRRLRHRVLLPRLPSHVGRRRDQGGLLLRHGHGGPRAGCAHRGVHRRPGPRAGAERDGRGGRKQRGVGYAGRLRLRPGTGLPSRQAHGRRRSRGVVEGVTLRSRKVTPGCNGPASGANHPLRRCNASTAGCRTPTKTGLIALLQRAVRRLICYHPLVVTALGFDRRGVRWSPSPTAQGPAWQVVAVLAVVPALLLSLVHCSDGEVEGPVEPEPPAMSHGLPNEEARQMCVVCHTCGSDGTYPDHAPIIDRTHDVCNECHAPDGSVIVHGDESCEWDMDCDAVPPIINCDDCHTVEYVNELCEECHLPSGL